MPIITLPEIIISKRAKAWAREHSTENHLLAMTQGELVTEFALGTDEPRIDDVTDLCFHTFEARSGKAEFIITSDGERLKLDLCERSTRIVPGSGPMAGRRMSVPHPLTKE